MKLSDRHTVDTFPMDENQGEAFEKVTEGQQVLSNHGPYAIP